MVTDNYLRYELPNSGDMFKAQYSIYKCRKPVDKKSLIITVDNIFHFNYTYSIIPDFGIRH